MFRGFLDVIREAEKNRKIKEEAQRLENENQALKKRMKEGDSLLKRAVKEMERLKKELVIMTNRHERLRKAIEEEIERGTKTDELEKENTKLKKELEIMTERHERLRKAVEKAIKNGSKKEIIREIEITF